ncbi:MAG: hypothetical protein HYZ53_19920 [Planctomycetes bacterium]|nr:hypothetical protein [Planctomycetota bacterium]
MKPTEIRHEAGQVAIEYILTMALVVAGLCSIFMAFPQVLAGYYQRVTSAICKP